MITLDLSILNQKGTPMFNSDIFTNRPAAGVVGRIFISTDTYEFYRDTGSAWDLIGGSGTGNVTGSGTIGTLPIWTGTSVLGNSTLIEATTKFTTTKDFQGDAYYLNGMTAGNGALYWTTDRVTLANYNVGGNVVIEVNGGAAAQILNADLSSTFYGYTSAIPSLTAANNASSVAIYGQNSLGIAAGFSSNNIGAIYGAIAGVNLQTFAGSATFAQANVASASLGVNSIDFSSAGSTITMTQAAGIRAMAGNIAQVQYQGTNSGTITHAAIQQNLGFYRPSAATGILTITNAYSHLINALDDYGAGFTFTNRWGIYQAGSSDKNYFAANMLLGSTTDNGDRLQITGNEYLSGNLGIGVNSASARLQIQYLAASTIINAITINSEHTNSTGSFFDWNFYGPSNATGHIRFKKANGTIASPTITTANQAAGRIGSMIYDGVQFFDNTLIRFAADGTPALNNTPGRIEFYTTSNGSNSLTEKMRLIENGNLLVGGTAALYPASGRGVIQVSGTTEALVGFGTNANVGLGFLYHTGTNFELSNAQNGALIFTTNSIERSRITGIGNTLIGTTTDAGYKLDVNGQARVFDKVLCYQGGSTGFITLVSGGGSASGFMEIYKNDGSTRLGYIGYSTTDLLFQAENSANFVFSNGNVLIGSTSNPGQKLYLNGSLRIDGQQSATSGGNSGQHLIINLDGTTYKIKLELP